jgi:hypothetical protein
VSHPEVLDLKGDGCSIIEKSRLRKTFSYKLGIKSAQDYRGAKKPMRVNPSKIN